MHRMLSLLLLVGVAWGQLTRTNSRLFPFDDSFESPFDDDSREVKFFATGQNNFNTRSRFRDSDEKFFGGIRSNANSFKLDDSDEFFRGNRNKNNFNRNRFSHDDSDEVAFFRTPNHNNKINTNFNRNRFVSVEDSFDDLFDDDLDDRIRAQNTLSRLRNTGVGSQFNRASSNNGGFTTNFNTRLGSDRVNNLRSGADNRFINTNRITNPFASTRSSTNTFPKQNINKNAFSFGTALGSANSHFSNARPTPKNDNFGSFSQRVPNINNPFTSNKLKTNFNNHKTTPIATANSIRSNPFSNSKTSNSIFPGSTGFNWPGGNGYYVRMSTGNSKPFSYFVKYDD